MLATNSQSRIACLLLALIFALAGCGPISVKQTTAVSMRTAVAPTLPTQPFPNAADLDAYLSHLNASGSLTGSVLVAHNGMLFSKGYGLTDRDARIPDTPQTRFRIGSVTKEFTAMAILILQERGKLHVQDHLCLYIANCPQDWRPITLYHLLTHSSGIPDYTNFPDFVASWTQPTTPAQLIARFKDRPLDFPPGSVFRYSNSGYVLLGYIVERVSGEAYATFLQEHIFAPLKMRNTGYDTTHPALPQHATGYYSDYSKPDAYAMSVFYAAGAIYSTVEDLYRWDQALMAHMLVSQQALDAMFTPHIPCPPPGAGGGCLQSTDRGYGYGWFIGAEPLGKLIYHVGRIDGFFAYNGFYPARNLYVVVLCNLETADVLKIGRTLAAMVTGSNAPS
ncbi:MAG: beta-lactamase family protein [Chloroflexota bacterium]|nr:beta-lactamase family protein [Chloroflexota bacterium]